MCIAVVTDNTAKKPLIPRGSDEFSRKLDILGRLDFLYSQSMESLYATFFILCIIKVL
jgi:hypothetical protein